MADSKLHLHIGVSEKVFEAGSVTLYREARPFEKLLLAILAKSKKKMEDFFPKGNPLSFGLDSQRDYLQE